MRKNLCLLLCILVVGPVVSAQTSLTKIFVVRHADRPGSADDLSEKGQARALELARVLGQAGIDSIYSTDFDRTRKTAMPLAKQLQLPVRLYAAVPQLVDRILGQGSAGRALVVGHSNTLDDVIRACGCTPPPASDPGLPETQYDHLFLILVGTGPDHKPNNCELIHLKYGVATD